MDDKGWNRTEKCLPDDREWYLGIFQEADTGWINPLPFVCAYVGVLTTITTKEGWVLHNCTNNDNQSVYYFNLKCLAWRPLPESPEWVQNQFKIGDEVQFIERPTTKFVITCVDNDGQLAGVGYDGIAFVDKNPAKWEKTGRHFVEAEAFMNALASQQGEENGKHRIL